MLLPYIHKHEPWPYTTQHNVHNIYRFGELTCNNSKCYIGKSLKYDWVYHLFYTFGGTRNLRSISDHFEILSRHINSAPFLRCILPSSLISPHRDSSSPSLNGQKIKEWLSMLAKQSHVCFCSGQFHPDSQLADRRRNDQGSTLGHSLNSRRKA